MATIAASFIGNDAWNASVYDGLSLAAGLTVAIIKRRRATVLNAFKIQRVRYTSGVLNNKLDAFFDGVYAKIDLHQQGNAPAPAEPLTQERIDRSIESLKSLHSTLYNLLSILDGTDRDQHSAVASVTTRLRRNDDRLVDLIDWIRDATDLNGTDSLFAKGLDELDHGETVSLD